MRSRGFAKCSGFVRSTKKKCEPMLEAGTCILVVGLQQNISDKEREKNVCFQL